MRVLSRRRRSLSTVAATWTRPQCGRTEGLAGRTQNSVSGRERPQVITKADAERGRGAFVVADQRRPGLAGPAAVGVPGPGEIRDPVAVGPAHVRVDVAVGAVALADLAANHRVAPRDR